MTTTIPRVEDVLQTVPVGGAFILSWYRAAALCMAQALWLRRSRRYADCLVDCENQSEILALDYDKEFSLVDDVQLTVLSEEDSVRVVTLNALGRKYLLDWWHANKEKISGSGDQTTESR